MWGRIHSGKNQKTKALTSLHHDLAVWLSGLINNGFGLLVFGWDRCYTAAWFTSQGYKTTQIHSVEYLLFTIYWASFWGRRNIKQRQCPGKHYWFGNQTGKHFTDVEFKPLMGIIVCLHDTAQCLERERYLSSLYILS